jgi:competence protein ComEA
LPPAAVVLPPIERGEAMSPATDGPGAPREPAEAMTSDESSTVPVTDVSSNPATTPGIIRSSQNELASGADFSQRPMIVSRSRIGPPLPDVEPAGGSKSATDSQGGANADGTQSKSGAITWKRPADPSQAGKVDAAAVRPDQLSESTKDGQPKSISPAGAGRKINVNKASAAELELLPDVGPALAKRIIDHRTKNGAFKVLDDLDKVSGIGPKTLEKLKDRVVFVDPPPPR